MDESDDPDVTELTSVVRLMVVATERYRSRVARQVLEMSGIEMLALGGLAIDGPSTPTHIARRLQITTPSATGLLDRLENAGLAQRVRHETDRRKVLVSLTENGRKRVGAAHSEFSDIIDRCSAALTPDQVTALLGFLRAVTAEVDALG